MRPSEDPRRSFMTMESIEAANKRSGRYWFSPDTKKHFKPIVESKVFAALDPDYGDVRLWVESITGAPHSDGRRDPRRFKIARFTLASGDIMFVNGPNYETLTWASKRSAQSALYDLLNTYEEKRSQ